MDILLKIDIYGFLWMLLLFIPLNITFITLKTAQHLLYKIINSKHVYYIVIIKLNLCDIYINYIFHFK